MGALMGELEGSARLNPILLIITPAYGSLLPFGIKQNQYLLPLLPSKSALIGKFFLSCAAVLSGSDSVPKTIYKYTLSTKLEGSCSNLFYLYVYNT